jgi:hypothetical protein
MADNKDYWKEYKQTYYTDNKNKIKLQIRQWRKNNKDKINLWYKKKRTDPHYRLIHNMRSRLSDALKGRTKHLSTMSLTGCSKEELIKHLESQFSQEMTWDNYGKYWCVDHIIPLISIDISDKIELEKICHYTNLRPLTIAENNSKASQDKICRKI